MALVPLPFLTRPECEAWTGVRGWLLPEAAEALHRFATESAPEGAAVEIGSFAGKSTICIARGLEARSKHAARLTAIDPEFQQEFEANLRQFNVADRVDRLQMPSLDAAETWSRPVSFLYIDGHHGKAYAYADFVVWDTVVVPGGIVALDDTIGFMLGPNLQVHAAVGTGAYELLSEVGGITFLRKRRPLVGAIGDFPLGEASCRAHVESISAWLGAMDPAFRPPRGPKWQLPPQTKGTLRRIASAAWNAGPRRVARKVREALQPKDTAAGAAAQDRAADFVAIGGPERMLTWLEAQPVNDDVVDTLQYLRACMEIRALRLEEAAERLRAILGIDSRADLFHYRIPMRDVALLRMGQLSDLREDRETALMYYRELLDTTGIPELRRAAEIGVEARFQLPLPDQSRLLREYNLDLARYRRLPSARPDQHA